LEVKWSPKSEGTNINHSVSPYLNFFCEVGSKQLYTVALPKEELERWIRYYWTLGFPDTKIADHVLDHFDRDKFGLRYVNHDVKH
jgi:hypothetical protein